MRVKKLYAKDGKETTENVPQDFDDGEVMIRCHCQNKHSDIFQPKSFINDGNWEGKNTSSNVEVLHQNYKGAGGMKLNFTSEE